jgi:hypothetical protein
MRTDKQTDLISLEKLAHYSPYSKVGRGGENQGLSIMADVCIVYEQNKVWCILTYSVVCADIKLVYTDIHCGVC